ncbi:hypothetical protein DL96DRAFT_1626968 [Flagelloscypha sp. PMI_526]|nr:hypothetical protein DL96DRAFT_1626968 [Flagelloscypha sp. PMI_526]
MASSRLTPNYYSTSNTNPIPQIHNSYQNPMAPVQESHTVALPPTQPGLSMPIPSHVNARPPLEERPPSYHSVHVPTVRVTYTFKTVGPNSMTMDPPPELGQRSAYHITLGMNCMNGLWQTTIRTGDAVGKVVGLFELGGPPWREIVALRKKNFKLNVIMTIEGRRDRTFKWNIVSKRHMWIPHPLPSDKSQPHNKGMKCFSLDKKTLYAEYIPSEDLWDSIDNPSKLIVEPDGQSMLDDLVLSLLIMERLRGLQDSEAV